MKISTAAAISGMLSILVLLPQLAAATEETVLQQGSTDGVVVILGASYAGSWPIELIDGRRVINQGVDGDETDSMLDRFNEDVSVYEPDAVLIWGFINDIFRSSPEAMAERIERTKFNIEEIVDRTLAIGAQPLLATEVTIPLHMTWDQWVVHHVYPLIGRTTYPVYVNQHVEEVNEWIRGFAASRGIDLIDFAVALSDDSGARSAEFTKEDGSHLNAEAYRMLTDWADAHIELDP